VNSETGCAALSGRPGVGTRLLLLAVEAYRLLLAPLLGGHCRFWPSCSAYAEEALRRHGAGRGTRLAVQRVLRCHPFHRGGVDLVP
jgi:putative membrane protein insertion efficiency factor